MCEKCMPKKWDRRDGKTSHAMTFIINLKVKIRDKKRCQQCGTNKNLTAHHIQKVADHPELRFEPNNIITLCKSCHEILHILDYRYLV